MAYGDNCCLASILWRYTVDMVNVLLGIINLYSLYKGAAGGVLDENS